MVHVVNEYTILKDGTLGINNSYIFTEDQMSIDGIARLLCEKYNIDKLGIEKMYVASSDSYGNFTGFMLVSSGDAGSCSVYSRNIATFLLLTKAYGYVLFHNHPTDELRLSDNDKTAYYRTKIVTDELKIPCNDTVVITSDGWTGLINDSKYYFKENWYE